MTTPDDVMRDVTAAREAVDAALARLAAAEQAGRDAGYHIDPEQWIPVGTWWNNPPPYRDEHGFTWLTMRLADGNPGIIVTLNIDQLTEAVLLPATDAQAREEIAARLLQADPVRMLEPADLYGMDDTELAGTVTKLDELAAEARLALTLRADTARAAQSQQVHGAPPTGGPPPGAG